MPAMNTSERSLATKLNGLGKGQMAHGRQFEIFPPEQIAIQDEEGGEHHAGEECQRQHGEVDEEGREQRIAAPDRAKRATVTDVPEAPEDRSRVPPHPAILSR